MHHLTCGRGVPLGARLFKKRFKGHMECHCLLFESDGRLVLVDAGLSRAELTAPRRMGQFARGLGLQVAPELAAHTQITGLGFDPADVTDVILTHLDLDHAGGLVDFPEARVHVSSAELEAARARSSFAERLRYRPQQWQHCSWVTHDCPVEDVSDSADLLGIAVPILELGESRLSYVALPGHTRGHCGVLVESNRNRALHCGDAYYDRSELDAAGSFLFRLFKRNIDRSLSTADATRRALRDLRDQDRDLTLFCSHDPEEFASLTHA